MPPSLLVVLPFAAIGVLALLQGRRTAVAAAAGGAMLLGLGLVLISAKAVLAGQVWVQSLPWLSDWGLDLAFRLDGLGFLFALLIYGIGALIVLYAYYYMPPEDGLFRFLATMLAFAGGMLGVVLAENLILLVLFWEVTSLASFLLIAYKSQYHDSRIAARMALAVTGAGGLALLAGVLLLGRMAGSFDLSVVLDRGDLIRAHPLYRPALVLVLLGAFTKSAQFPFHFWLPNAMAAPTPVSAYLHSATMVKAGVFLLARLYPALSGTETWFVLVTSIGMTTLLLGAYLSLLKHDFKGLLAYSTISHLGLITTLFGLDTSMSAVAGVFHIINHAVFKGSLFMVAGVIDRQCGTRDMRRINGLAKYMPDTAALGITAALSMAGAPFLNGFLSKEMFFQETVSHPGFAGVGDFLLPAVALVAGIFSVAYSLRFIHDVFFNGEPVDLPRTPGPPPRFMRLPMEVLVALVVAVGVAPQVVVGDLLRAAAAATLDGPPPPFKLAVWHGFNLPLVMSIVALGGGAFWYARRERLYELHERLPFAFSSPVVFERGYDAAAEGARRVMAVLDRRVLRRDLGLFLGLSLALGAWAWATGGAQPAAVPGPLPPTPADPLSAFAFLVLALGVVGATWRHRHRLEAIILTSSVGLVVSLVFVRFAAPDLALTQLSVELATILLLLLALRFLPPSGPPELARTPRWRVGLLATGAGVAAAILTYALLTRPFRTISGFHIAQAKPGGGGTNVVNVILVDFRGFDTLGEVAVLAMAGLGVRALLQGLRPRAYAGRADRVADRYPLMLRMLMQPLLPLALAVAVYIFLRGHNLPGGGFIAGLLVAIALVLQYMAGGYDFAAQRLRLDFVRLMGAGLALSLITGAVPWAFGQPFLKSAFVYLDPPLLETFELASAAVFDLGILLVVVGTVLVVLTELGRLPERADPETRPHAVSALPEAVPS
ncbi:MAG: monovalent cation/H+ antiporter subunit A [Sphingomonadaceae bacterium]|uniref:monovalent cation/H+ antiporter subunit A n=1 Tax=Thermaurantiacus sp. TaxID=2820283 RepID=UPI00298F248F|nr:monovalent cation/H+ antiporter subunit A [Thermaurantiacus sp.]MCS6987615.1 monovalent cation/H+ antiporter subunit A [Sphingomonadaceae bacterium]MDW8415216.1 monovalent cation/H+ antiporter subunit A [Thermaurantiacus sp.]